MTTCAIGAYHHYHGEVCSIQHYVIKFAGDLRQVVGFLLLVLQFTSTIKTDRHDITEILFKKALNTITPTLPYDNDVPILPDEWDRLIYNIWNVGIVW